ncbi:hypothetical protein C731_2123 [Mycolicibacterium hassiacum DSM 44199]|uniref:Uncharacterized protein n=1 Tax=Mycolicibacterium hassiacum (strain DSM 44199 / CIP 105218 / JCM 12690 / 3849) TaxID=1122247 RepID=K5BBC6_MYCHD|nr:hypothetical protein C731_2123 [Mycolicibacterium hassiacum DSM 44199]MDA4085812.1 hypothetical protein [Mycolicibacterium hassiacum DSM 44199]PZN24538.1 MAG: hypothetical protein DIU75_02725 [Mycolicibacterium hassiacum]
MDESHTVSGTGPSTPSCPRRFDPRRVMRGSGDSAAEFERGYRDGRRAREGCPSERGWFGVWGEVFGE